MQMREIKASAITDTIERLCIEANQVLPSDIKEAIGKCRACEDGQIACGILDNIIENYQIAENEQVPICQDTGMACVFLEIGQDVHITDGDLTEAVNEGVRRGYTKGYLRKSVVKDPVRRGNTGDNTPAMLYTEIVPGEQIRITVGPQGFGSENMSAIRMFKPSAGIEGIHAGDTVYLTGTIYTSRDAGHKRMCEALARGEELPFDPKDATIYYVGPTPAKPGQVIGSAGPTTSGRMDAYAPTMMSVGARGMIGKGARLPEVVEAMKKYSGVYFGAIGGAGALLVKCIKSAELVAYEDLQSEALRRLYVEEMPLVVIIDSEGNNLYEEGY